MNCSQFNKIALEEVLQNFGHLPTKQSEKEAWYLNPFAPENHASFKLNKRLNSWYLFSEGIGGNNIDFMKKYLNTSISEVLVWAENQSFSSFQNQKNRSNQNLQRLPIGYEKIDVKEIQHPALLDYLKSRNVEDQKKWVEEVHYRMSGKNYFGIGFKNDSGGYEIRNAYSKICLGKKDITSIKNDSKEVRIFEGFFDLLSFKKIENYLEKETSDYIILNSVSMIHKIKKALENYNYVELYFDNDEAGTRAVDLVKNEIKNAEDCRVLYSGFKDVNEWLIQNNPREEKQIKYRRRWVKYYQLKNDFNK
ncbi:DNA primase [Chryseobacterium sp. H3056]|uniref:DNA primase n=1 Tax=Kaistella daneshvariae TaxID=2487074 RepID=A0A3N0WTF8_9FLAO|nr:toprim domain-containing protein [Kaistella daneshvariae]ROI08376.1 DNA primase [Kaistella daneshvariae]